MSIALKPLPGSGPEVSGSSRLPPGLRSVVTWDVDPHGYCTEHEHATRAHFARRLAALKGCTFAGVYDPRQAYGSVPYFVPSDTLTDPALVRATGITGVDDLF
ncbi:MAG: DUF3182 family protein, partial [Variovorax sp.]